MQLTREQLIDTEPVLLVQRGNIAIDNFALINAILFVAVNGCTWRALPSRCGRWHTVYTRMRRWAKNVVLDRVFEELQVQNLIHVTIEAVQIDLTSVNVHPDGTGARKKGGLKPPTAREGGSTPRFIWLPRAREGLLASS